MILSVTLKRCLVVQPGLEPATFRSAIWRPTIWANQAAVIWTPLYGNWSVPSVPVLERLDWLYLFLPFSDKEAPTVQNCPKDIFETTDTNAAAVTWVEPTFSDNVRVANVEKSHNSGASFDLGSTNVNYVALDEAGNRVSCQFTVSLKRMYYVVLFSLFTLEKCMIRFDPVVLLRVKKGTSFVFRLNQNL